MLEIGTKAKDFSLQDARGEMKSLKDYLGKKLLIYFYSKDNTPGCTKQALGYSCLVDEFKKCGVEVVGVSKDSVASHEKFTLGQNLKLTLLSDPEKMLKWVKEL